MKKQIVGIVIIGAAVLATLLAWANTAGPPWELLARVLMAVWIVGLFLAIQTIKKKRQRQTLEQTEGSFEREMSVRAQSEAYIDALVILVLALAVVAVFGNSLLATLVVLGAIVLIVLSFWIRYQKAKMAFLSETADEKYHS